MLEGRCVSVRKRAYRVENKVGESRGMFIHPNGFIAIHHQNNQISVQQLLVLHLWYEFSTSGHNFWKTVLTLRRRMTVRGWRKVCDDSDAPAKLGERHHRSSGPAGIILRLTLDEYASEFCQAPQRAGARQEVRAHCSWPTHLLTLPRCVDYAVKIRVNPDQKGIDLSVKHSMVNNIHVYALLTSYFPTEPL